MYIVFFYVSQGKEKESCEYIRGARGRRGTALTTFHSHWRHHIGDTLSESSPSYPSPVPTSQNYHRRHDDENLPFNLAIFRLVLGPPLVMSNQWETIEVKPILPFYPSPASTPLKSKGTRIWPRSANKFNIAPSCIWVHHFHFFPRIQAPLPLWLDHVCDRFQCLFTSELAQAQTGSVHRFFLIQFDTIQPNLFFEVN